VWNELEPVETAAGSKGSPDVARDVGGFAVKFYTKEGNWDLVGNNIPVFFIQDAIKFPDLIHAVKPAPDRGFPQAQTAHDNFRDFVSLTPESMHMIMWIISDRYSSVVPHNGRLRRAYVPTGQRQWQIDVCEVSLEPRQGLQSVEWNEAVELLP
jgi:catalase